MVAAIVTIDHDCECGLRHPGGENPHGAGSPLRM